MPPTIYQRLSDVVVEVVISVALTIGLPFVATAGEFPDRPITFVVPLPPGGSVDAVARELGQRLQTDWNRPVVVDNKPGASNIIGAGFVARAPKDGYTILLGVSGLTTLPSLFHHLPFDVQQDFAPVAPVAKMPFLLLVPTSNPANSVKDLIALAKAKPGQLNYGSYGNGTAPHLSMVKFATAAGIDVVHVPYKGTAPALNDMIAGRLSMMISDIGPAVPFIKSGQLKALAITSAERSSLMPNLPTVAESGLPGYEASGWFGVFVPAGTPDDIIAKYNSAIGKIMSDEGMKRRMAEFGLEAVSGTPAQLAEKVRGDIARNADLINRTGIRSND